MAINVTFGMPKISFKKEQSLTDEEIINGKTSSIFTTKNLVLLGAGIAIGVIIKQQSDIHTLRRTVQYLQEALR